MKQDIQTMTDCYASCLSTINHCLERGGEHASKEHINLLMDCAKLCQLEADFAIRGSQHHAILSKLCADVCRRCADECEKMSDDDDVMKACAKTCRSCADTCERME